MSLTRGMGIAGSPGEPLSPHPAGARCAVALRMASFGKGAAARDARGRLASGGEKGKEIQSSWSWEGEGVWEGRSCLPAPNVYPISSPVGLGSSLHQGLQVPGVLARLQRHP